MIDVLKTKFCVSHTASTERKFYQVIFLRLLKKYPITRPPNGKRIRDAHI